MGEVHFPEDFRDFLRLLGKHGVEYLLIGGYAVGYHGFPRTTLDMDIWVAINPDNANRLVRVLKEFGFSPEEVSPTLFESPEGIIRMGVPPLRLELLKEVDGVEFGSCFERRVVDTLDGIEVSIISLRDLRTNKAASARHKDLADLENLPES